MGAMNIARTVCEYCVCICFLVVATPQHLSFCDFDLKSSRYTRNETITKHGKYTTRVSGVGGEWIQGSHLVGTKREFLPRSIGDRNGSIIIDHSWGGVEHVSLNYSFPYELVLPKGTELEADVGIVGTAGNCDAVVVFTGTTI